MKYNYLRFLMCFLVFFQSFDQLVGLYKKNIDHIKKVTYKVFILMVGEFAIVIPGRILSLMSEG